MKKTIALIFGGCSAEYAISLQSAYAVTQHLNYDKYLPVMVGITPDGEWVHFTGDPKKIAEDTWYNEFDCKPALLSPSRKTHELLEFSANGVRGIKLDAVFPVLHGKNGEDGTVQGLLELAAIPIIGCNTLCSALCMDKDKAHKIIQLAGVKTAQSFVLDSKTDMHLVSLKAEKLGYPLFVKPLKAGSSYGITKVLADDALSTAIQIALKYDKQVIVEENIEGFEVGCAVLGNDDLIVGEIDEIELTDGFFDFTEKYTLKTSAIHVPARITTHKAAEIKETAKTIYKALGCSSFARVDMFLTLSDEIIFNEVNTIPGFTDHSRYPNMLKAIGMSLEQIFDEIIDLAVKQ